MCGMLDIDETSVGNRHYTLPHLRAGCSSTPIPRWFHHREVGFSVSMPNLVNPISDAERQRRTNFAKAGLKHGFYQTSEYQAWLAMRQRCNNSKHPCYKHYGARGITVCEAWKNFEQFIHDMGCKPTPKHWLERRDNSRGYSPDNCYWATPSQQLANTRRTIKITIGEETKCLKDWAICLKLNYKTIIGRVCRGWKPIDALLDPIETKFKNHRYESTDNRCNS